MKYFFYVLTIFFTLKIIWNFLLPLVAVRVAKEGDGTRNISLMPVEFVLLIFIAFYSYFKDDFVVFGLAGGWLFLAGAILIAASYLCPFFILRKVFK